MFCASYVYLFNLRWTGFTSPQPIIGRVYPSTLAFYPSKGRMDGSLDEAVPLATVSKFRQFSPRRLSPLSCINEYLAIDSGGNVIDLVLARNCCLARMIPGKVELLSE